MSLIMVYKRSVPVHQARQTVDLLSNETSEFIPSLWTPNSPDLYLLPYSNLSGDTRPSLPREDW